MIFARGLKLSRNSWQKARVEPDVCQIVSTRTIYKCFMRGEVTSRSHLAFSSIVHLFNCYTYQNREKVWSLATMTLECYACLPRYLFIDIKITNYKKAVFLCTCNNDYTCYSSLSFSSFWRYLILSPNHHCNTIFTSTADINRKTTFACSASWFLKQQECENSLFWKMNIVKAHETAVVKFRHELW